jgi:hypothetical protein
MHGKAMHDRRLYEGRVNIDVYVSVCIKEKVDKSKGLRANAVKGERLGRVKDAKRWKRTQEGEKSESKGLSSRVWKNDRKEKISEIMRNAGNV